MAPGFCNSAGVENRIIQNVLFSQIAHPAQSITFFLFGESYFDRAFHVQHHLKIAVAKMQE